MSGMGRALMRRRAEFWTTRDPSTIGHLYDKSAVAFAGEVLALLDRLEAAEAAMARVRALVPIVRFDEEPPRTEYLLRRDVLTALAGDDEAGMVPEAAVVGAVGADEGSGRVVGHLEKGAGL